MTLTESSRTPWLTRTKILSPRLPERKIGKTVRAGIPETASTPGDIWCIANWGTKWWVGDVFFADYGTSLEYRFDTAWSPPNPVVERLIKDWPTLDFELHYKEVGMGFIGLLAGKDGEVDCNRCEKYRSRLSRY